MTIDKECTKMQYKIIERGLGLVVLGDFNPATISINAMVENGIIREEEVRNSQQQQLSDTVSECNVVNIRIGCDKSRVQMATVDIVAKERLSGLCCDILRWQSPVNIQGVGVNPHLRLSFEKPEDHDAFTRALLPSTDNWQKYYDGAYTSTFQIIKKHVDNSDEFESMIVRLTGVNNNLPVYTIDMNVHHILSTLGDTLDVCADSPAVYEDRVQKFETFLSAL